MYNADCSQHDHYHFLRMVESITIQMSLLDAMNTACEDITADHCRDVAFSPPVAMAMENIRCDVDENLWPEE